ncbi:hypothetical protein ACHHYP_00748 [Achlya hypogyna]|uniref:Uncharacterized protein n=1 Tax=Achlya hypogyna TaxID=1202772 RepID=A0A1V9ZTZ1_ACHHY|nr:hypothetical protein ACHHYP_00748 [Achlya hypogyna]
MAARVSMLVLLLGAALAVRKTVVEVERPRNCVGAGRATANTVEITTVDITGSALKDRSYTAPEGPRSPSVKSPAITDDAIASLQEHPTPQPAKAKNTEDEAFKSTLVDRPHPVLTPEQMHRTAMAVFGTILIGGMLIAISSWVQARRRVTKRLAWLSVQTDKKAIAAQVADNECQELKDAFRFRIRLLDFDEQVDKLEASVDATSFDSTSLRLVSPAYSIGDLLASVSSAVVEVNNFAREARPGPDADLCAKWYTKLTAMTNSLTSLQTRAHRHLKALLASQERQMNWSVDEFEQMWRLWNGLGLEDELDHEWFATTRDELRDKHACISRLSTLRTECLTLEAAGTSARAVLDEIRDSLATAKRRDWAHEVIVEIEAFAQDRLDATETQLVLVNYAEQLSPLRAELALFREQRDVRIEQYMRQDELSRGEAAKHLERMMFDYALHVRKLEQQQQLALRQLDAQRRMHQEALVEKQRRDQVRALERREHDRAKYAAKLEAAQRKQALRLAERQAIRKERCAEERAKEVAQLLTERRAADWVFVQRWLRWNACLLLLLLCMIFWEVVSTSDYFLSTTCDAETSYWTPYSSMSRWGCQMLYAGKVAGGLVLIVVVLALFAYANLPSVGLGLLAALFFYAFRQVWREMLIHWRYMLGLAASHYVVGQLLTRDRHLTWRLGGWDLRPILVYLVYPLVSCALTIAVGAASCPLPQVCIEKSLLLVQLLV